MVLEYVLWVFGPFGLRIGSVSVCQGVETEVTEIGEAPEKDRSPGHDTRLLCLWDFLGIPHKQKKQIYGESLTIIGLLVDSRAMSISLSLDASQKLVAHIRSFLSDAPGRRCTLREWQQTLGWINWGLNVHPLLRPALASAYNKIRGKEIPNAPIYINEDVQQDLSWVADMFEAANGFFLMKSRIWGPSSADLVIFCDASLTGMGFWCPRFNAGFLTIGLPPAPSHLLDHNIYWFESLCVLSTLLWAASLPRRPSRLAIFTDNLNTVQVFASLRAYGAYNDIIRYACSVLILTHIDLRVWHILGDRNIIADALSRQMLHVVRNYYPTIQLSTFIPPRLSMGDST